MGSKMRLIIAILIIADTFVHALPQGAAVRQRGSEEQGNRRTLRCWQCAVLKDYPIECPRDAVQYELTGWTACTSWRLSDGTVVLQNFVDARMDCTPERLAFWSNFITRIWGQAGVAECCFEDSCNDARRHIDDDQDHEEDSDDDDKLLQSLLQSSSSASSLSSLTSSLSALTSSSSSSFPRLRGCLMHCSSVKHASCRLTSSNLPNVQEINGQKLESVLRDAIRDEFECVCNQGFLPIRDRLSNALLECHDPIIRTGAIGGRCLIDEHCTHLNGARCRDDTLLQVAINEQSFKTCQCRSAGNAAGTGVRVAGTHCGNENDDDEFGDDFGLRNDNRNGNVNEDRDDFNVNDNRNDFNVNDNRNDFNVNEDRQSDLNEDRNNGDTIRNGTIPGTLFSGINNLVPSLILKNGSSNEENSLRNNTSNSMNMEEEEAKDLFPKCSKSAVVVEQQEWTPTVRFPLRISHSSSLLVLHARLPLTAPSSQGLIIRLFSSSNRLARYSVTLRLNGSVTISSAIKGENELEVLRNETLYEGPEWFNSEDYTGLWLALNRHRISVGLLETHPVDNPILSWTMEPEQRLEGSVDTAGLTSLGSAVFVQFDCDHRAALTGGVCLIDEHCARLANTSCKQSESDALGLRQCSCLYGFQEIPKLTRSRFLGGCFDPIGETMTLGGECRHGRHCRNLINAFCHENKCQCLPGFEPGPADSESGLNTRCFRVEKVERTNRRIGVHHCDNHLDLQPTQLWIPEETSIWETESPLVFFVAFEPKISSKSSMTLKLFSSEPKSNPKSNLFYRVSVDWSGRLSVFESFFNETEHLLRRGLAVNEQPHLMTELFQDEIMRMQSPRLSLRHQYRGFWIKFENGLLSVGRETSRMAELNVHTNHEFVADADQVFYSMQAEQGVAHVLTQCQIEEQSEN